MRDTISFSAYLRAKHLSKTTISEHELNVKRFKRWAKTKYPEADGLSYTDLMAYISEEKERGVGLASINLRLNSISKYYAYLQSEGLRPDNPAIRLRVKNPHQKVKVNLLKPEELQALYENYKTRTSYREDSHKQIHERNTILLGLIVFQGLDVSTLRNLECEHINFDRGTIYAPSTKRSAHRHLALMPFQTIPLHTYVMAQQQKQETKLFTCHLSNTLTYMLKELKTQNRQLKNIGQLRASVITNWIKQESIRKAQYMAGHRHISSTEHYRTVDMENLQIALLKYHPIN